MIRSQYFSEAFNTGVIEKYYRNWDIVFYCRYAFLPFASVLLLLTSISLFDLDRRLAHYFYELQGFSWLLKDNYVLEEVIHKGGRTFSMLGLVIVLVLLAVSFAYSKLSLYRKGFIYLLLCITATMLIVQLMKLTSGFPCPWSVLEYGGAEKFVPWNTSFTFRKGCFPAGHASGGYVWISLFFFCKEYFPNIKILGLSLGVVLGVIFGVAQQIRGAHFISHDLATLSVAWFSSLIIYVFLLKGKIAD